MALGLASVGFEHELLAERDRDACETIRVNARRGVQPVVHWPLGEGDVRDLQYADAVRHEPWILSLDGCQPWIGDEVLPMNSQLQACLAQVARLEEYPKVDIVRDATRRRCDDVPQSRLF